VRPAAAEVKVTRSAEHIRQNVPDGEVRFYPFQE